MIGSDDMARGTGASNEARRWDGTLGYRRDPNFAETRWSLVLKAQAENGNEAGEAMNQLCQSYWYPLYAFARRSGKDREEASDLTQEFFRLLLEKDILARARQDKGRLRTFLLTVMKRFLIREWHQARAEKRGGGMLPLSLDFDEGEQRYRKEPADEVTPEVLYDRQWAMTLLGRVMESLREDYINRGMGDRFDQLKEALWWNSGENSYATLGEALGMNDNAVRQAVSRMRKQYRAGLKEEIRITLPSEDDKAVDQELAYLIEVLRKK